MLAILMGRLALRGGFYAACAGAGAVLVLKFYPLDIDFLPWAACAIAAAAALAALVGLFAAPGLNAAAIETDRRSGLAERLSTALALAPQAETNAVVKAVQKDATAHAAGLDVGKLFRFESPWEGRYLSVPLLVLVACHLALPEFDLWGRRASIRERKEQLALMTRQAAKLRDIKEKMAKGAGDSKDWGDLEANFEQTAQELTRPKMTRPKAMAKLSKLAQALEQRRQRLAGKGAATLPKALERRLKLTKRLAEAMNAGKMGDAAKELRSLAQKLADGSLSAKAREQLKQELAAVAEALLKQNPGLAKALAEAAEKLTDNEVAQAADALRDAGLDMKELQQMLQQIDKMDRAIAQLAQLKKDLGGQGPFAICRGCGCPIQCDNALCDKMAGGECPLGGQCPHACGFCPACRAAGLCDGMCVGVAGRGAMQGKGKGGKGPGMRGPGQGRGGEVGDMPDADTDFEPSKIKGMHDKAKPLGLFFTRGAGKKGKSKVKATAVVRELRQAAQDALAKERIPAGHKRYIRQYFNTIEPDKKRIKDER